jgi:hypothetical protein
MTLSIEIDVDLVRAWAARGEVKRLAEWLCKIYPRWIEDKKTTQADVDMKMAALKDAILLAHAVCTAMEAAGVEARAAMPAFSLGKVTDADREMRPQCRFCRSFGNEDKDRGGKPNGTFICPLPNCPGALAHVKRDIFEGRPV